MFGNRKLNTILISKIIMKILIDTDKKIIKFHDKEYSFEVFRELTGIDLFLLARQHLLIEQFARVKDIELNKQKNK